MEFMVSLITDGTSMSDATAEEMEEFPARMAEFMGELQEAGALVHTGRLGASAEARTLRYGEDGQVVVTDGPFTESKEQTAGYMVLDCGDLDEALGWVRKMPILGRPAIEVRPIERAGG